MKEKKGKEKKKRRRGEKETNVFYQWMLLWPEFVGNYRWIFFDRHLSMDSWSSIPTNFSIR